MMDNFLDKNPTETENVQNAKEVSITDKVELEADAFEHISGTSEFDEVCEKSSPVCKGTGFVEEEITTFNQHVDDPSNLSEHSCKSNNSYYSYVGLWPESFSDNFREYFVLNKPEQNIQLIANSRCMIGNKERVLTEASFFRKKKNNELLKREWLVFSPAKNAVFCYICKLFSASDKSLCKGGFSYWKNTSERLKEHKNSMVHRNSVLALSQRLTSSMRIDSKLVEEYANERLYWRKVLARIVATTQFLCQRGLVFFGRDETIGSFHNGNFLCILELLGKFDPFLAEHLAKYGNTGTGNVNYLSSTVVTELISIMSQKVLNRIVTEVQTSKYYGLIVDSTPDITHNDQLSIVLCYVDKSGRPLERFVKFLNIYSHDSLTLCTVITSFLENLGVDIKNCRGQSYDNSSNMSGKYSGLQARIKETSPTAEYIPCSAHSLNLVGVAAVESCEQAISFFGLIQSIYNFSSASTHRWAILSKKLKNKLTVKSLSITRWSAAAEATKSLQEGYKDIMQALFEISSSSSETSSTKCDAKSLYEKIG
ncbi:zinc finger MYM-type protein 1 [Parasteatoda tepidariorum]|uniref:zinc finger MYM-type protein 1 n=1 Tax=Parasteatoda tepidariorum TaxID=114398 RepID=UPI001C7247B9|nr:zinc finger MYM-type protein 1-like [Parasteatoda tepidariorum]